MADYIIIITMVLLFSGCSTNQGFEGYRYNPFQYPYPEYYLKAETIPISSEKMKAENNMVQLEYFGLRSYVQAESFNPKLKDVRENTIIFKDHDKVLVIDRVKDSLIGCDDEQVKNSNKDFCSAFDTSKEYYEKLFTVTPQDLRGANKQIIGNKWIVHRKGFTFENVEKLHKYTGRCFVSFESIYKSGSNMTKDMILFRDKTKQYYIIFATNHKDDLFFKKLLETLQE